MAEKKSTDGTRSADALHQDAIAQLISLAGRRPSIPQDVQARVHASVRTEWQRATAPRRAPRWTLPAVFAATVAVMAVLSGRFLAVDAEPVATVELAHGITKRSGARLAAGDPVFAGDAVVTDARGAALVFSNGLSLRLAGHTMATVNAGDEITLADGRIYADTGSSRREERLITVHTPAGSASDLGTQFVVGYDDQAMTVAVRKGRVDVTGRGASWTAEAGQKLTVQPGMKAVIAEVAPYDRFWDWASALAPAFDIDNRTVFEFLNWAARETGRELVFADDGVKLAAMASSLSGSIAGFTPAEAIDAVLPTTRFEVSLERPRIIVAISE